MVVKILYVSSLALTNRSHNLQRANDIQALSWLPPCRRQTHQFHSVAVAMYFLPKANPLYEQISTDKVLLPELLEKLVSFNNRKALILPFNSKRRVFWGHPLSAFSAVTSAWSNPRPLPVPCPDQRIQGNCKALIKTNASMPWWSTPSRMFCKNAARALIIRSSPASWPWPMAITWLRSFKAN